VTPTEEAILRTLLYADVFSFPMTLPEIHHFLIADDPIPIDQLAHTLEQSETLRAAITYIDGFYCCAGRQSLLDLRHTREQASQQLWAQAVRYGSWLAHLPFVRMVALTGALAMRNASSPYDDLDYVLVTAPGRVWIARGFAVLLVKLVKRRGVVLCPNYVLSLTALEQERRDLFIAHEVAQMVPLYGLEVYAALRNCNRWVAGHMPNAEIAFHKVDPQKMGRSWGILKRGLEALLSGTLGDRVEAWEQRRKQRKLAPGLQTPHHAAKLDAEQVKGHFNDHGHPVLQQYRERLRRYHIEDVTLPLAGD
jgi:hypothetical protein